MGRVNEAEWLCNPLAVDERNDTCQTLRLHVVAHQDEAVDAPFQYR